MRLKFRLNLGENELALLYCGQKRLLTVYSVMIGQVDTLEYIFLLKKDIYLLQRFDLWNQLHLMNLWMILIFKCLSNVWENM